MLTEAMNEVKSTVEAETYGVYPNDALVTPLLQPPVKIDVQAREMATGTPKFDHVVHEFGTLTLDFSKLMLGEVYAIQHVVATEIRIRENALAYQATKQKRKEKSHNTLLHQKYQEIEL